MSWDDAKVERLKSLWQEGLSASQVAAELGGVSRSSVCAKIARLGLTGRSAAARSAAQVRDARRKQEAEQRRASRPPKAPVVPRAPYQGNGHNLRHGQTGFKPCPEPLPQASRPDDVARVTLLELRPRHCRWPIGMPGDDGFGFCGLDAEGPYCAGHATAARKPPRPGSPRTGNELMRSLRRYA